MTKKKHPNIDGQVVGLVLAAGASTRMGAGRNKLLESIAGRPLVAWPIAALAQSSIDCVFVVLGHEAAGVREGIEGDVQDGIHFLQHVAWADGMGASIAFGLRSILDIGTPSAVAISVGDLPGLRASIVSILMGAVAEIEADDFICLPTHGGRDGHPVIFGRSHFEALCSLSGDHGARRLVERHADRVVRVAVDSDAILRDVDSPDALAGWQD